jgi:hypothetical protein
MRCILLVTIVFISSCGNRNEATVNRPESIKKEMQKINAFYYKKIDSLDAVKRTDTSAAKQHAIAVAVSALDNHRYTALLALQKEYDALELEVKKW